MADVSYKLVQPEKVVKQGNAWGVVLPTGEINLTVIAGQAPSIVKFDSGLVKILDEDGKVCERYFVKAGIASIVSDTCVIASETVWNKAKLKFEDMVEQAKNDAFCEMIVEKWAAD
ncbi:MAG: hypothetical protein Q4D11_04910 [Rhodospirillales bacterium]|nr:hypothetical protein [Rhodospirillales bacterium]